MRNGNALTDARLIAALGHPIRVSVLALLADGRDKASPSELADELGLPLPNLSYHVRRLVELELIILAGTRPRRGAIEHYYRLPNRQIERRVGELAEAIARLGRSSRAIV